MIMLMVSRYLKIIQNTFFSCIFDLLFDVSKQSMKIDEIKHLGQSLERMSIFI